MNTKQYKKNLVPSIVSAFFLSVTFACTSGNEITTDIPEENVAKYDSTYNAAYNLYVVSDDTTAYDLSRYSSQFTDTERQIGQALNEYAAKMLSEYSSSSNENTILSPVSATMLYSMMANFMDEKSKTNVFMESMGIGQMENSDVNSFFGKFNYMKKQTAQKEKDGNGFYMNSNMWMEKNNAVYKSFLSTTNYYGIGVKGMELNNRSALSEINKAIASQMGSNAAAINNSQWNNAKPLITNSVAFKNEWKEKFAIDSAKTNFFVNSDGSRSACKVLRMLNTVNQARYSDFFIMEIPYKDESYSMFVIVPHNVNGLSKSISALYRQGVARTMDWVSNTSRTYHGEYLINRDTVVYGKKYTVVDTLISDTIFDIRIPKVKINTSTTLNSQDEAIAPMYKTNLPKVSPRGFVLGDVIQACSFEIDENSTSATGDGVVEKEEIENTVEKMSFSTSSAELTFSAVDLMDLEKEELESEPIGKVIEEIIVVPLHAAHPFAIFIRDNNTGTISFACSIKNLSGK